ncbi:MAG: nucleotidyltransferase domain-containing protein [Eggerthellaceae bacterium]|nr:nucleotidyltransferase domain-containing protein [Eggerthellaceae bacterium]
MDKERIKEIVVSVIEPYDIREAYLYGSYARGTESETSDVDLRFLCGDTMNFAQLLDIQHQLESELQLPVDIATAPPEQMRPSFYNRIRRDEVKLYASV